MGSEDLNLGHHTSVARTLSTEPSPQSFYTYFPQASSLFGDKCHYTVLGKIRSLKASVVWATHLKLQSVHIFPQIPFHSKTKKCTDFPQLEQWVICKLW